MGVLGVIRRRRSVRRYQPREVELDKLVRVLEAGRLAPSAANRQPWRFVVVKDEALKSQLARACGKPWVKSAFAVIVACGDPTRAWLRSDGEEYWKVDVAIAVEHMVLTATEEGLGTCWIAAFNEEAVREIIGAPKHVRVLALIPIGYPAEEKGEVVGRKPLEEVVSYDRW